ncbi:MAG: N-acetylmuramoyl-L-alanine amidase [Gammaproteobacteria bacterium]
MRTISTAIVHCADTYKHMDIGVREIRSWHVDGNGWDDIGYHYVIRRDGSLEDGRPIEHTGAHAAGHNHDSVGICLVGGKGDDNEPEFNYTMAQIKKLHALISILREQFPGIEVIGHRDVSSKACPCFDVKAYFNQ